MASILFDVSELHHVTVPQELDGSRLDSALARLLPDFTRSFLARCIEQNFVSIDGQPVSRPAERVRNGQRIALRLPPPVPAGVEAQEIPLTILHQDPDLAVIDKPAGLVVHPAAGHADRTLVNALMFHLSDLSGLGGEIRPGILHRLDKDTSGLIVVAKNDAAHRRLTSVWRSGEVIKEYLALVYGTPAMESGTIDKPIGRDRRDRKRMAIVPEGRAAITHWRIEERLRYASLLRCRIETGRTHQIRVHLKSTGHPIVGDPVYSGPQWRGIPDRKIQHHFEALKRQALHATRLRFPHPATGEPIEFTSELPEDIRELVEKLRG